MSVWDKLLTALAGWVLFGLAAIVLSAAVSQWFVFVFFGGLVVSGLYAMRIMSAERGQVEECRTHSPDMGSGDRGDQSYAVCDSLRPKAAFGL